MYDFSIDIPFKGSQSLAKMMSKVKAVSYLHAVHVKHVTGNRLCNRRFSRRILIHNEKGFNPCLRGLGAVV
jgi:hypothetical protein